MYVCESEAAYRPVGNRNTGGSTCLRESEALHHGAAEADFEELLHMGGQGGATCHYEPHFAPQASPDLAEDQLVKERRGLQVRCKRWLTPDILRAMIQFHAVLC